VVPFLQRRKRRSRYSLRYLLMSILAVLSLGAIGIGFAAWDDTLTINGTLTTGNIEPIFTKASLSGLGTSCGGFDFDSDFGSGFDGGSGFAFGDVIISEDGKSLDVIIKDAQHDDVFYLDFQIKNIGTLPVKLEKMDLEAKKYLKTSVEDKPKKELKRNETTKGKIKIKIDAPDLNRKYDSTFRIRLDYCQAL
jgi:hypothetical protein